MELKEFSKIVNFSQIDDIYTKINKGYYITLFYAPMGIVKIPSYQFVLKHEIDHKTVKKIREKLNYKRIQIHYDNNNVLVCFLDKLYANDKIKPEIMDLYRDLVDRVTDCLIEMNIEPQEECVFCNDKKYEKMNSGSVNNLYLPYHQSCYDKYTKKLNGKDKQKSLSKEKIEKEPLGGGIIILTIIGGIIGILPIILFSYTQGKIFAPFYMFIPVVASIGFKIGGGTKDRMALPIILVSTFMTLLLNFGIHYLDAYQKGQSIGVYLNTNMGEILASYGLIIFFLIIGIILSVYAISRIHLRINRK
ncbi:MAG: hypothetical protein WCS56_03450 [Bacilli bacterium]